MESNRKKEMLITGHKLTLTGKSSDEIINKVR
jgi:hypothetical protein